MKNFQKIFSLVLAWIMALAPVAHVQGAFTNTITDDDRQAVIMNLRRAAAEARAQLDDFAREQWDIQSRADQIGNTPEDITEWVGAHIAWIPYHGVLRGARGTLMEGRGNHLDRALLLSALLKAAGHEDVKLVPAKDHLPGDQVQAAIQAAIQAALAAAVTTGPEGQPIPADEDDTTEMDPRTEEIIQRGNEIQGNVRRRAHHLQQPLSSRLLYQSPKAEGHAIPSGAWSDYWTVALDGIPLQLGVPGIAPPPEAPQPTGDAVDPDELPEALYHMIELRFNGVVWEGGDVENKLVFEHTVRAADLIGKPIQFNIKSQSGSIPASSDLIQQGQEELKKQYREAMLAQNEWFPVLSIGDEYFWDKAISEHGVLNDNPQESGVARGMRQAAGALGGIRMGARSRGPSAHLIGLEMEWVSASPGQPAVRQNRVLYDALPGQDPSRIDELNFDDDKRLSRAVAFSSHGNLLALPGDLGSEYIHARINFDTANLYASIADMLEALQLENPEALGRLVDNFDPGIIDLLALSTTVRDMRSNQASLFIERPLLLGKVHRYQLDDEKMTAQEILDFIFAQYGSLEADPESARKERFQFGLVQTILEDAFAEGFQVNETLVTRVQNTAKAYAESLAGGDQWLRLQNEGDLESLALPIGRQTRETLRATLAAGSWVYLDANATDGDLLWWDFNPESGDLLGRYNEGWGAVALERGTIYSLIALGSGMGMRILCASTAAVSPNQEAAILRCFGAFLCGLVLGAILATITVASGGATTPLVIAIPFLCSPGA